MKFRKIPKSEIKPFILKFPVLIPFWGIAGIILLIPAFVLVTVFENRGSLYQAFFDLLSLTLMRLEK